MKTFATILLLAVVVSIPQTARAADSSLEIERLPYDDAFHQWLQSPEIQNPTNDTIMYGSTDPKTGKSTPTPFWMLTCRLGQDAHLNESFLISALNTNAQVSLILDSSPVLCSRYGVHSEAMVTFDPKEGYTIGMRNWISGPEVRQSVWLDAIKKTNSQPNGARSQSHTIRPKTNGTSSAANGGKMP